MDTFMTDPIDAAADLREQLRLILTRPWQYENLEARLDAALAAFRRVLDAAAQKLWECDACGFGFDARHVNPDGTYSCPVCEAERLKVQLAEARSAERERCAAEIREVAARIKSIHYADAQAVGMLRTMEEMAAHIDRMGDRALRDPGS